MVNRTEMYNALAEYIQPDLLDELITTTGGDIISLLKRHIGPIFIIGVDGRCVILSFKKGLVRIHVDGCANVVLRRDATLIDKVLDIEMLHRVLIAVGTLDYIVTQKEADNVKI